MGEASASGAEQVLDALGDPMRRSILELLGEGPRSVQAIADDLPVSRPAVSRHLRLLKDAGLVAEERQGTRRIYELRSEGVEAVQAYFAEVWREAAARFSLLADNLPPGDGADGGDRPDGARRRVQGHG